MDNKKKGQGVLAAMRGVVYQKGARVTYVDIALVVKKLKKIAKALKLLGIGAMMAGAVGIVWIWSPLAVANLKYQIPRNKQVPMTNIQIPNWEVPDGNYSIYIPKIGAISRVITDVDANNKKEYLEALRLGVAEAKGLGHPGEKGTTFLFAHSVASPLDYARYNAVFYLLDKLESGDEIEIVYKNRIFRYSVFGISVLDAKDTRYLRPQKDEELLVLQTCWPAGTRAKRLVLTAKPVMVY
ncbi:MAG: Sortase family protein [Microgenomates group bacterium Gr01-1014_16]|nr:MAG: Sortase family protein [Microgenomates group bacterium Gr01-1014_16]